MKTHDAAKLLKQLLEKPSVLTEKIPVNSLNDLEDLPNLLLHSPNMEIADARLMKKTDELAVSLKALTSLSKYSKQQWVSIIDEFNLPIDLNPRASTRDVVGKVLGYLEAHPEVLRVHSRAAPITKRGSQNLEDTLNKLIHFK